MTTILFAFIVAFALALVLTPAARWLGVRLGAMDAPSARKVHTRDIPRSGGIAIAAAFVLALTAGKLLGTQVSGQMVWEQQQIFATLGGVVIFAVGFCDDLHRLVLIKNLSWEPIQPFTLRRVEYLRRSLVNAIARLIGELSPY